MGREKHDGTYDNAVFSQFVFMLHTVASSVTMAPAQTGPALLI